MPKVPRGPSGSFMRDTRTAKRAPVLVFGIYGSPRAVPDAPSAPVASHARWRRGLLRSEDEALHRFSQACASAEPWQTLECSEWREPAQGRL